MFLKYIFFLTFLAIVTVKASENDETCEVKDCNENCLKFGFDDGKCGDNECTCNKNDYLVQSVKNPETGAIEKLNDSSTESDIGSRFFSICFRWRCSYSCCWRKRRFRCGYNRCGCAR